MRPSGRRIAGFLLTGLLWAVGWGTGSAPAADFTAGFDGSDPEWRVVHDRAQVRLVEQSRDSRQLVKGRAAERIELEVGRAPSLLRFELDLPPARVIDDLKLSVWFRANRPGFQCALRVVFPYQKDPATGALLSTYVKGDVYAETGRWQLLDCALPEAALKERLVVLRARLQNPQLDSRGMYVDRVVLVGSVESGRAECLIDELKFGPVVSPQVEPQAARPQDEAERPAVEFRLDRLLVHDVPFFPRLVPYHGEPLDLLRTTGVNVVWVPDFGDDDLLGSLQRNGLWAVATPPRPQTAGGEALDGAQASLLPFTARTAPILGWYGGTRVAPQVRREMVAWCDQVRTADRTGKRPFLVDVAGDEREFSRQIPMLGTSRHVLHSTVEPIAYRDWLVSRRKLARPGSFLWTWIQTEPDPATVETRRHAHRLPMIVEPEQLRMQTYAALAAGCRGLGFWKSTSLDADLPGAEERRLALEQIDQELRLLEPWLATAQLVGQIPFRVTGRTEAPIGQRRLDFRRTEQGQAVRDSLLRQRDDELKAGREARPALEAALVRTDHGLLLLPVWFDPLAQFVPGQQAGNDATIVVPGADESASAWEVTTTDIRSVPRERVAGGLKITLAKFDQTAAVILTADRNLVATLRQKMAALAQPSARTAVALTKAKLDRVRTVDDELRSLGAPQPDGPQLLGRAGKLLDDATQALAREDWHAARQLAADSLQLVRILQRAHWNDAVRDLASPVSSPHTLCFQTLPDHWRLLARFGRCAPDTGVELLRAGDFEDIDTMVAEHWQHAQAPSEEIRAAAELHPAARQGKYCLRLVAVPATGSTAPAYVRESPVRVTTPPLDVRAGQIVHVSGWVRIPAPLTGNSDGFLLHDSLVGPAAALRWRHPVEWTRFELLREVHASGTFTLTASLKGLGEVLLDDLRVTAFEPRPDAAPDPAATPDPRSNGLRPLDLLNRIPGFRPGPVRR